MKRNVMLLMGVAVMFLATGCCCLSGGCGRSSSCCGYSPAPAYGGYGGGGGCSTGNCGIGPGASLPYPQTSYYGSYDSIQAGIPQGNATASFSQAQPMQSSPFYGGYASTAMVPREPLPTF